MQPAGPTASYPCLCTSRHRVALQECDDFISRGIAGTGAGFDAASAGRLGGAGFGAHNPDPSQLRERMLKARAAGVG